MITINLFNGKRNDNPEVLDGIDYWKLYYEIINLRKGRLTFKDIEVLAWVTSKNNDVNYFLSPGNKELVGSIKCSPQELSKLKKKFYELGILDKEGYLSENIKKLRNAALKSPIMFVFPITLSE
jgi:hypothetical protein